VSIDSVIEDTKEILMTLPSIYKLAASSGLTLILATISCQALATTPNNQYNNLAVSAKTKTAQPSLTQQALNIQQALANKNYASIINDIHPTRGVRF
jgi:hypothetical protein